tara:strand:- start:55 stop:237 length:183 start_codon:yes stop_codon:yes gene_type:complete
MIELDLRLVFVVGKGVRLCVEKKLEERLSGKTFSKKVWNRLRSGTGCKIFVVVDEKANNV